MIRPTFGAVLILAVAAPARADGMDVALFKQYLAMPGGATMVRTYMGGLRDGILMFQDRMRKDGKMKAQFCIENEKEISEGLGFEKLVIHEIEKPQSGKPYPADTPIAEIATTALEAQYPCKSY